MKVDQLRRAMTIGVPASAVCAAQGLIGGGVAGVGPSLGVNCFDLMMPGLAQGAGVRSPILRLRELASHGIPFVRFAASPFWPKGWAQSYTDKMRFVSALNEIVEESTRLGIGLIPTIFWYPPAISYWKKESLAAWGEPQSETLKFLREHVGFLVGHFKGVKTILFWELANEFNTYSDRPASIKWWPKLNPDQGTPDARFPTDLVTTKILLTAGLEFERAVKAADPSAKVGTGNDLPRADEYNAMLGVVAVDTPAEMARAVVEKTPTGFEFSSVHIYPDRLKRRHNRPDISYFDLLNPLTKKFQQTNKKWYIGEFGVPRASIFEFEQKEYNDMLLAIRATNASYAALWVYDFKPQSKYMSVEFGSARAYQLEALGMANSTRNTR